MHDEAVNLYRQVILRAATPTTFGGSAPHFVRHYFHPVQQMSEFQPVTSQFSHKHSHDRPMLRDMIVFTIVCNRFAVDLNQISKVLISQAGSAKVAAEGFVVHFPIAPRHIYVVNTFYNLFDIYTYLIDTLNNVVMRINIHKLMYAVSTLIYVLVGI